MDDIVPSGPLWAAFLMACLVLAVTPGPGVIYVVTRTLAQGRAAGLASVGGVAVGNLGNAAAASLGLAAMLAWSSAAFTVVKLAGAAYLVYLGVQTLRPAPRRGPVHGQTPPADLAQEPPMRIFRQGLLVALLNPKTAIFFAAFLPQFMSPGGSPAAQSLALGAAFVVVAAVTDTAYVLLATAIAPALQRSTLGSEAGRWLTAVVYIGLGVWAAVSDAGRRSLPSGSR
jgi:threonine/homoserine/homoserine lactone efflux protein